MREKKNLGHRKSIIKEESKTENLQTARLPKDKDTKGDEDPTDVDDSRWPPVNILIRIVNIYFYVNESNIPSLSSS